MGRNNLAVIDWPTVGPRVLAWMRATAPHRHTLHGLSAECAAAMAVPGLGGHRLNDWLVHNKTRAEWGRIKATLGTGNGKPVPPNVVSAACSLDEFAREKRREGCPVCALSADVRAVLATAGDKGHKVALQVEWLNVKCGATVTRDELLAHRNGGHDR